MSNFRVTKPVSGLNSNQEIEVERFAEGAEHHEVDSVLLKKTEKPLKSFTIPLNDFELDLLRRAAKKDNRSQRYIARLLLVQAMHEYLSDDKK